MARSASHTWASDRPEMLRAAGRAAPIQLRARAVLRHHARSMSLDERAGAPGVARLDRGFIQLLGPDAVESRISMFPNT